MARRTRSKRTNGKKKLPLAIAIPMAMPVLGIANRLKDGQWSDGDTRGLVYDMTGYSINEKRFHIEPLLGTYGPMVAGVVVHKVIGSRVNRYIPKWIPVGI